MFLSRFTIIATGVIKWILLIANSFKLIQANPNINVCQKYFATNHWTPLSPKMMNQVMKLNQSNNQAMDLLFELAEESSLNALCNAISPLDTPVTKQRWKRALSEDDNISDLNEIGFLKFLTEFLDHYEINMATIVCHTKDTCHSNAKMTIKYLASRGVTATFQDENMKPEHFNLTHISKASGRHKSAIAVFSDITTLPGYLKQVNIKYFP